MIPAEVLKNNITESQSNGYSCNREELARYFVALKPILVRVEKSSRENWVRTSSALDIPPLHSNKSAVSELFSQSRVMIFNAAAV